MKRLVIDITFTGIEDVIDELEKVIELSVTLKPSKE
jgi:hypothetical protein